MLVHRTWLFTFGMVLLNVHLSCAYQILHPFGKPGIQPLVLNITADPNTKRAFYYARFTGPPDTKAMFDGTFRKVSTSRIFSEFEAVAIFSLRTTTNRRIVLTSPFTTDLLWLEYDVNQSIYQTEFDRIPCEFEVKKSQDYGAGIVQYSVRAENCDIDNRYDSKKSITTLLTQIKKSGEKVMYSLNNSLLTPTPPDYIFDYCNMTGGSTGSGFHGTMTMNVKKMATDDVEVRPPMFFNLNVRYEPLQALAWGFMYITI